MEFAFTHTHSYGENYFSFVNGHYTNDGGTHQSAFREGLLKGVNEFAKKSFAGEDVRDGIIGAVAIKLQDPVFESQTKNKLGTTEVRSWIVQEVREAVTVWMHKHRAEADKLLEKVKANERVRKELASIKKEARERAKKTAIRIPKLTDCKRHLGDGKAGSEESTIFSPRAIPRAAPWCPHATSTPRPSSRSRANRSIASASSGTRSTRTKSSTTSCARSASRMESKAYATTAW